MAITKRNNLKTMDDICGKVQELGHTDNIDVAHITITDKSTPHLHRKTEEIYFILKGEGLVTIDDEQQKVEKDDTILIPKNKFHSIDKLSSEPLELLAITSPGYDPDDVIEKNQK